MKTIKKIEIRVTRVRVAAEDFEGNVIQCSRDVAMVAGALLSHEDQEVVLSFLVDAKNRLQGFCEVARGGLVSCTFEPRDAFRAAIMQGAVGVVFVHNHPSGDCLPSEADNEITTRLRRAGVLLGVEVLDHVIVPQGYLDGPPAHFSYLDSGWNGAPL